MNKKYFVHDGVRQSGPYSYEQLIILNLNKDSFIWFEGLADWEKAENIEELKNYFASKPPVFKSTISKPTVLPNKKRKFFTLKRLLIFFIVLFGLYLLAYMNEELIKSIIRPKNNNVENQIVDNSKQTPNNNSITHQKQSNELGFQSYNYYGNGVTEYIFLDKEGKYIQYSSSKLSQRIIGNIIKTEPNGKAVHYYVNFPALNNGTYTFYVIYGYDNASILCVHPNGANQNYAMF